MSLEAGALKHPPILSNYTHGDSCPHQLLCLGLVAARRGPSVAARDRCWTAQLVALPPPDSSGGGPDPRDGSLRQGPAPLDWNAVEHLA